MGTFDSVNSDAVGTTVIDGGEDGHLAVLFRERGGGIGAPQLVGRFHNDPALVRVGGPRVRLSIRREHLVFAHQSQQPLLPDTDALVPQAGPDFR